MTRPRCQLGRNIGQHEAQGSELAPQAEQALEQRRLRVRGEAAQEERRHLFARHVLKNPSNATS